MNNIVLCGFMGCGKSTVGKNIARKSGRKFLDMDSYIEEKAGMTVSKIFEKYGEENLVLEDGMIVQVGKRKFIKIKFN